MNAPSRLAAVLLALFAGLAAGSYGVPGASGQPLGPVDARPALSQAVRSSSTNYAIEWSAFGEISGGTSGSPSYSLDVTVGQMAARSDSVSPNFGLCTGFQCVERLFRIFGPLAVKDQQPND